MAPPVRGSRACARRCSPPRTCSRRTRRSWPRRSRSISHVAVGRSVGRRRRADARQGRARAQDDGTRVWSTGCDVIPQIDRIGGAIAQISIFFNQDARGQFISPVGDGPKLTGTVAGYPEYNGWVLITKDRRLPWIPQTLADRLDDEGAEAREGAGRGEATARRARRRTTRRRHPMAREAGARLPALPCVVLAEQLRAPAVWGDPTGEGRKRLEAEAAAMRKLSAADQQQADALGLESRNLERQAQAETRNKNAEEAARLGRDRRSSRSRCARSGRRTWPARCRSSSTRWRPTT